MRSLPHSFYAWFYLSDASEVPDFPVCTGALKTSLPPGRKKNVYLCIFLGQERMLHGTMILKHSNQKGEHI